MKEPPGSRFPVSPIKTGGCGVGAGGGVGSGGGVGGVVRELVE